jgi:hypothetical protein
MGLVSQQDSWPLISAVSNNKANKNKEVMCEI